MFGLKTKAKLFSHRKGIMGTLGFMGVAMATFIFAFIVTAITMWAQEKENILAWSAGIAGSTAVLAGGLSFWLFYKHGDTIAATAADIAMPGVGAMAYNVAVVADEAIKAPPEAIKEPAPAPPSVSPPASEPAPAPPSVSPPAPAPAPAPPSVSPPAPAPPSVSKWVWNDAHKAKLYYNADLNKWTHKYDESTGKSTPL